MKKKYKNGKEHPNFKGGWVGKNGYRYLRVHRDDGRVINGMLEHRLIMEKHLGRELKRHEHIHHINGDTLDNSLENLRMTDCAGHIRGHWGITDKDVSTVKARLREGLSYRKCMEGTNIKSTATIGVIKREMGTE